MYDKNVHSGLGAKVAILFSRIPSFKEISNSFEGLATLIRDLMATPRVYVHDVG